MNDNTFRFKYIDMKEFQKGDKKFVRVIAYCSFGFIVNLFTTTDKAVKLNEIIQKDKNYDISNYVKVFYDNKSDKFAYIIKF